MISVTAQKYRSLVEKLYDNTLDKKLTWTYNDFEEDVSVNIAGRKVEISTARNSNKEPIVIVRIFNDIGQEVETFTDESIIAPNETPRGFDSYWLLMKALFETAKRQATGADEHLDDILDQLD